MVPHIQRTHYDAAIGVEVQDIDARVALGEVGRLAHVALQRRNEDLVEPAVRDEEKGVVARGRQAAGARGGWEHAERAQAFDAACGDDARRLALDTAIRTRPRAIAVATSTVIASSTAGGAAPTLCRMWRR